MTRRFSDLGISTVTNHFIGDKIKIQRILNKEITVIDYKVSPSQIKGDYAQIQIEIKGDKHVVFTGSVILIETLKKIPQESFPFITTIVQQHEHFEFT